MFEKQGKFYADWRDKSGKRLRKSFNSERAALRHEADMKDLANPKRQALDKTSPKFSARKSYGGNRSVTAPTSKPRNVLSPLRAAQSPAASRRAKSLKLCTPVKRKA